jgi:hypothetical protein
LTTPNDAGCQRIYPDEFGPKKKPFGFNFMGLLTAQNVLVSLAGAKAGLEKPLNALFYSYFFSFTLLHAPKNAPIVNSCQKKCISQKVLTLESKMNKKISPEIIHILHRVIFII